MSFDAHSAVAGSAPNPEVSTPAPQETPKAPEPTPTPAPQPAAASTPTSPESPYSPNYKFSVRNKEHEFDPFIRDAIKDPDSEKKVRELYEKAYGLDTVKPKVAEILKAFDAPNLEVATKKVTDLVQEAQSYRTSVEELKEHFKRGDMDSFFATLGVPEEKILQWVINKAQYSELPPEQRKILDEKKAAEQKAYALEKQQGEFQQQYYEQVVSAKNYALQVTLERQDVKSIADAFDTRAGRPGAFREAVIDAGELAWVRSNGKIDLTPEQAVQQVLAYWGNPAQQSSPPIIPVQQEMPVQQPQPAPRKTLPNVASKQSSSVARSSPRSIEDLKKLAAGRR